MRTLILTGVMALLAACAAPPSDEITRRPPVTVAEAVPPGMAAGSAPPSAPTRPECEPGRFDPRKSSLRPLGPLPPPGQMPAGSTMERIVRDGQLVVGVDQNLTGFSARDPFTGRLQGFDIDVAGELALALFGDRTKVRLRTVNFSNNFDTLDSGAIDILVDSLTITCERRYGRKVMFSTDYFDSGQRVLVKARSPYRSADDLAGRKVCAPAGTTSIGEIRRYGNGVLVPVAVPEFDDCLVMLQQNQIEAVSTTDSILIGMVGQDPTLKLVGERFTDEPHGLAMREGDQDWVRFVNGVLQQMRDNGRWLALYRQWFAALHEPGGIPFPATAPEAFYID
jgi:polar amino acid transport system substrate-binding protein